MNKIKTQEEFFNHLRSFVTQNNIRSITESNIYSFLISFGIHVSQEKKQILSSRFKQQSLYNPLHNTSGAKIIKDDYFYWLMKGDIDAKSAIKLYITLDADHLEKGSLEIFEFLNKEGIQHQSKIRGKVTIDNVVIRLDNMEDAKKISNFIKNNRFIQEGLNNPNPFLVTDNNGVSYGLDGLRVSVNGEISRHIYNYINSKVLINDNRVMKNELNNISREDFYNYLHFLDRRYNNAVDINNQNYNILRLLLKSESPNYNNEDFEKYVNTRKDLIDKNINREDILAFAVKVLANKYGFEKAKMHLEYYLDRGDISAFSRNNNTREMINLYISQKEANRIVDKHGGVENYLKLIGLYYNEEKMNIIISSSLTTLEKYGPEHLKMALNKIIRNNDYSSITREKNARITLKNNVSSQIMVTLISSYLNRGFDNNNELINNFVYDLDSKYVNKNSSIKV